MAGALRLIRDDFREFFLQEKAEREASSRSANREVRIRDFIDAADARLEAAAALHARDQLPVGLALYRLGILFAIRALLEARGRDGAQRTDAQVVDGLAELIEARQVPVPPAGFERARALLAGATPLALDDLAFIEAIDRRSDMQATAHWLRGLVDTRTVRQIKWHRALRLGVLGLAMAATVGSGVKKALTPRNLALGKPVEASSRRQQCPPGSGEMGLLPSGLVDGLVGSTYDICTNSEVRPWVSVDLQKVRRVSKVIVYNRADCCWGASDLPAVLELSEDATSFREVARRTTAYSATDPWVIDLSGEPARFVKLRVDANEAKELVLTELEVY